MTNPTPNGNRVLVRYDAAEKITNSGLVIPDQAQKLQQTGVVVGVGVGRYTEKGVLIPIDLGVGDHVLFEKYGGSDFEHEGERLVFLEPSEVLAVLDN